MAGITFIFPTATRIGIFENGIYISSGKASQGLGDLG